MNHKESVKVALSGVAVVVFFHLLGIFAFSKREGPFSAAEFCFESFLLVVLGFAVFKLSKRGN